MSSRILNETIADSTEGRVKEGNIMERPSISRGYVQKRTRPVMWKRGMMASIW